MTTTITLDDSNPQVTVTTPGSFDISVGLGAANPQVTFSGSGTFTINNLASAVDAYTIEATKGATVVVNSMESLISLANLVVNGESEIQLTSGITALSTTDVTFTGTGGTIAIDPGLIGIFDAIPKISGFAAGDHIELGGTGTKGYSVSYNSSTGLLELKHNGQYEGEVKLSGSYIANDFTISTDANGNTEISYASCFLRGTRIGTPEGEAAVETLRIGDLVTVAQGGTRPIKWIGRRAYLPRFAKRNSEIIPVCIRAGALGLDSPARDLYVSPRHAVVVNGMLVQAIELVNGRTIVQDADPAIVEYFHIELDQHAIVFAEGAPTESYAEWNNRHIFQNAHEYVALYGEEAAAGSSQFCLPLIDGGPLADAARAQLAARAGLSGPTLMPLHRLLGFVDHVDGTMIEGWAMDEVERDIPLVLDILAGGELVARTVADRYRPDLSANNIGSGRHGFRVVLPMAVGDRQIVVRRSIDGAVLNGVNEQKKRAA